MRSSGSRTSSTRPRASTERSIQARCWPPCSSSGRTSRPRTRTELEVLGEPFAGANRSQPEAGRMRPWPSCWRSSSTPSWSWGSPRWVTGSRASGRRPPPGRAGHPDPRAHPVRLRSRPDLLGVPRELRTNLIVHQETPSGSGSPSPAWSPGREDLRLGARRPVARRPRLRDRAHRRRPPGPVGPPGPRPGPLSRPHRGAPRRRRAGRRPVRGGLAPGDHGRAAVEDAVGLLAGPTSRCCWTSWRPPRSSWSTPRRPGCSPTRRGRPLLRRLPARRAGRRRSAWRSRGDDRPPRPGRRPPPRRGAQPQPPPASRYTYGRGRRSYNPMRLARRRH